MESSCYQHCYEALCLYFEVGAHDAAVARAGSRRASSAVVVVVVVEGHDDAGHDDDHVVLEGHW